MPMNTTLLTRGAAPGPRESSWRADRGEVDQSVIDRADVVVNLAGSPTLGNPHSKTWQRNLRESRVTTTRTLAEAKAWQARTQPGPLSVWHDPADPANSVLEVDRPGKGGLFIAGVFALILIGVGISVL